jgi:hypothetical protein
MILRQCEQALFTSTSSTGNQLWQSRWITTTELPTFHPSNIHVSPPSIHVSTTSSTIHSHWKHEFKSRKCGVSIWLPVSSPKKKVAPTHTSFVHSQLWNRDTIGKIWFLVHIPSVVIFMRPSSWNPGRDIIIPLFLDTYRNRSPNESWTWGDVFYSCVSRTIKE